MNGWIKIHRKLLNNPIFKKSNYFHVWCCILLLCNHDDNEFIFNNKKTVVKRGQCITSSYKISELTGVSRGSTQKIFNYLKRELMVELQGNNKYTLISVKNYDEYQEKELDLELQKSYKKATKNPKQEYKEINNNIIIDKNVKNFHQPTIEEVSDYCLLKGYDIDPNYFIDYYSSRGWMIGKNKIKDWKACIRTWVHRNTKKEEIKNVRLL